MQGSTNSPWLGINSLSESVKELQVPKSAVRGVGRRTIWVSFLLSFGDDLVVVMYVKHSCVMCVCVCVQLNKLLWYLSKERRDVLSLILWLGLRDPFQRYFFFLVDVGFCTFAVSSEIYYRDLPMVAVLRTKSKTQEEKERRPWLGAVLGFGCVFRQDAYFPSHVNCE